MKQFQELFSLNENKLEIISLPTGQRKILTLNQFRLLECLMEGKGRKNEIMEYVWEDNNIIVSDGSYHQLVFQTRQMLESIGLSPLMIKTLPRHGLKLVRVEPEQGNGGHGDAEPAPAEFITQLSDATKIDTTIAESLRHHEGIKSIIPAEIAVAAGERPILSKKSWWLIVGAFLGPLLIVNFLLSSQFGGVLAEKMILHGGERSVGGVTSQSLDQDRIRQGLALVDLWEQNTDKVTVDKKGFMDDFVGYKYLCLYQSSKKDTNGLCTNYILMY